MHRDLQTEGGSGGPAVLEATERLHYYDAADRLVAVDARLGTAPGSGNYLHFLLTFDTYRYDALGRRVWVRSERRCAETSPGVVHPGADFYADCRLGFVHRTVWDGVRELAEVRMPDVSAHWERDSVPAGVELGQVSNGT
ncbi:MAG: hypothetical protein IT355_10680, partial [Gemmatimonadaceae bacterium]|nr:hypothetical protein [Gemmatimonadaceae bacterium]